MSKKFFSQNELQKVFNIKYSVWKKTFKNIHQLSCFVGHPVPAVFLVLLTVENKLKFEIILEEANYLPKNLVFFKLNNSAR